MNINNKLISFFNLGKRGYVFRLGLSNYNFICVGIDAVWFRIFGHGLSITNIKLFRNPIIYSRIYKYDKHIMIGNYCIRVLPKL